MKPVGRERGRAAVVLSGVIAGVVAAVGLWGAGRGLAGLAYDQRDDRLVVWWLPVAAAAGFAVFDIGRRMWAAALFTTLVCLMPMLRLHVLHQEALHDRGRVERAVVTAEYERGALDAASYSYDLKLPGGAPAGRLDTGARRLAVGRAVTVTVDPRGEVAPALGRRTGTPAVGRALETGVEAAMALMAAGLGAAWGMRRTGG
ncbi:hypothetical protein ACH4ZX_09585 [Streptomyces sp. NPDC020490]|uniref:hypothetical protein n=1 Tax=Streptomyces sp. NPDC020490 TaxID=3365078 RepID=UPI0037AC7F06